MRCDGAYADRLPTARRACHGYVGVPPKRLYVPLGARYTSGSSARESQLKAYVPLCTFLRMFCQRTPYVRISSASDACAEQRTSSGPPRHAVHASSDFGAHRFRRRDPVALEQQLRLLGGDRHARAVLGGLARGDAPAVQTEDQLLEEPVRRGGGRWSQRARPHSLE